MKKFGFLCITALTCISLAACGNTSSHKSSASSSSSSKVVKKHKVAKKHHAKRDNNKNQEKRNSTSNSSSQRNNQQNGQAQNGRALTQGEINRQRGYDPNGAPLLPGQDHAAGSNPDGSPDAWVQWQLDHQNDKTFPDGTPLPNGGNNTSNESTNNGASGEQ